MKDKVAVNGHLWAENVFARNVGDEISGPLKHFFGKILSVSLQIAFLFEINIVLLVFEWYDSNGELFSLIVAIVLGYFLVNGHVELGPVQKAGKCFFSAQLFIYDFFCPLKNHRHTLIFSWIVSKDGDYGELGSLLDDLVDFVNILRFVDVRNNGIKVFLL